MSRGPRLKNAVRDFVEDSEKKAEHLIEKGDYSNAVSVLIEAIASIPEPKSTYSETGMLWFQVGTARKEASDYANAIEAYTAAAETSGIDTLPIYSLELGYCYERLGERDKALDLYLRARDSISSSSDWKEFFQDASMPNAIRLIEQATLE